MKKSIILFSISIFFLFQMQAQRFQHNIDESLTIAQAEQKNILVIFSGSDWCKSCIQLKKEIISSHEFIQFSDENLVLLELDFPYRKQNKLPKTQQAHNEQLAEEFNPKGLFPRMVLLDSNRQILEYLSYSKHMTTNDFIQKLDVLN